MSRILNLAWLSLLQVLKDRSGLFTLFFLPLMLTFLFGTMMGGGERKSVVAIADLDGSEYSRQVVEALPPASWNLLRVSEDDARSMTSSGEVAGAVVIPAHFGDDLLAGVDTTVTVVQDPRSNAALVISQTVRGRVLRIAATAQVIRIVRGAYIEAERLTGAAFVPPPPDAVYAYADRLWSPEPPLSVDDAVVTRSKVRGAAQQAMGFQQYSIGFTLMFMLFMGFGSAGGFLEEREQGTLARLLTTPAGKATLVAGKVLGVFVTVAFQALVMVGLGVVLFRVPWGDDPLGVIMLLVTFALAATGLGVMASTLVRTRGQLSAATAISATALSMLGGAYWPLDIVNPTMRTIAMLTPTGWAIQGLTDVVVRAQGTGQAVLPSLVLLGMAMLFLAVGVSRLKLE